MLIFPNIKRLITITCTFAVTSAKCEHFISCLQYLKDFMKCTMLQERLNGLAMLYIHRDIDCPPENGCGCICPTPAKETLLS